MQAFRPVYLLIANSRYSTVNVIHPAAKRVVALSDTPALAGTADVFLLIGD